MITLRTLWKGFPATTSPRTGGVSGCGPSDDEVSQGMTERKYGNIGKQSVYVFVASVSVLYRPGARCVPVVGSWDNGVVGMDHGVVGWFPRSGWKLHPHGPEIGGEMEIVGEC